LPEARSSEPVLLTSFFDLGHVRLLIGGALVEDDFLEERRPTRRAASML